MFRKPNITYTAFFPVEAEEIRREEDLSWVYQKGNAGQRSMPESSSTPPAGEHLLNQTYPASCATSCTDLFWNLELMPSGTEVAVVGVDLCTNQKLRRTIDSKMLE